MWVRGLKLNKFGPFLIYLIVAPRVGAWIETEHGYLIILASMSHPVWVRGLKLEYIKQQKLMDGRTPCGCVD